MDRSRIPGNPIQPFLDHQGFMVLDGGLATTLEARGWDLNDPLWSGKALLQSPESIAEVHLAFLEAGADCITSASYQATIDGFMDRGLSKSQARALLRLSAELACDTRDGFWAEEENRVDRMRPLVAASIGPYGAYLADGSEYSGAYALDEDALYAFHAERWEIVSQTPVDLIACETIPSLTEVRALRRLIEETPDLRVWMSFSCRNEGQISDGTPIEEVVGICDPISHVAAIGVNCVAPGAVRGLIGAVKRTTTKPIVVYPNTGEGYDAQRKEWTGEADDREWSPIAWHAAGAMVIGGCCRVMPEAIRETRNRLEHSVT